MTKRLRADLSLAFCSLLWGATFVVVKSSLNYSSVFVFLAARFTLAAVFGLYFLTVPSEGISHLNRGDLLAFVAAGLYAMHIILVGNYSRRHSVAALSVLQVAACAALAWPATGVAAAVGWQPARFGWQAKSLLGIAICAVLATAVAFSIRRCDVPRLPRRPCVPRYCAHLASSLMPQLCRRQRPLA
jgi:drug/metabolite transporter (DMT)-like permease